MTTTPICFAYGQGDFIRVRGQGITGTVDAMSCDRDGMQYRIVYWRDGVRHSVWVYDCEIESVEEAIQ